MYSFGKQTKKENTSAELNKTNNTFNYFGNEDMNDDLIGKTEVFNFNFFKIYCSFFKQQNLILNVLKLKYFSSQSMTKVKLRIMTITPFKKLTL